MYRKKIMLSAIVAMFAFVTFIGATYAWFTVSSSTDIEDISLRITSSDSLLIKMDNGYNLIDDLIDLTNPATYTSTLTNELIAAVYDFTSQQIMITPVTSPDGAIFTLRDGITDVSHTPSVSNPGQYIEFSVWILSQATNVTVALSDVLTTAVNVNTHQNDIVNSVRISLQGISAANASIYGFDKDYDFAFLPNLPGYSLTPEDNIVPSALQTSATGIQGIFFKSTGSPVVDESVSDKLLATELFELTAGTPEKVTIRIWLEGWDLDCDLNILGSVFDISFSFIIKEVFA